jgi:transcription elongation GreA/GreB family factor
LTERNLAETRAALEALARMAAAPAGPAGPALNRAGFGSLVETSQGAYLLGISIGEIEAEGKTARTASLASPIGAALKGRRAGDSVPWRGGFLDILRIDNPPAAG